MSSHDIPVNKPLSKWDKPLTVKFRDLFKSLTSGVAEGAAGKADGVVTNAIDALSAIEFGKDASGIAWLLIFRSLMQAIDELVKENKGLLLADADNPRAVRYQLGDLADDPDSLLNQLDWSLEEKQLAIDETFFKRPRELAVLADIQKVFAGWLREFGLTDAQADAIADRLPSFFVYALNDQWRMRAEEYEPLLKAFNTPVAQASAREQSWDRYHAWLQKQVDEKIFDEAFSLRQVYIPPRAYYRQKVSGEKDALRERQLATERESQLTGEQEPQKVIVRLEEYLEAWLRENDPYDAVKVISGGPGSGKSSFAKMFAARQAQQSARRILFIPLRRFEATGDLILSVEAFVRFDRYLGHNPLDPKGNDFPLLIIFDGLDELSEQKRGEGAQAAQQFVGEVQKKVILFNGVNEARLKVIITGRELAVQSSASEFRRPQQIVTMLPYLIPASERGDYFGKKELIELDQRPQWWEAYGRVTGKGYKGLPEEVDRPELEELTSQPLLNYLIAQLLDSGEIDYSAVNSIYEAMHQRVFIRSWERSIHPATKEAEESQFKRIMEEVAVAVWHGDGRKASLKEIVARCERTGLAQQFNIFRSGVKQGVTNLMLAFYFRRAENDLIDELTFEFTNKSFSEYLIARRIVGVVALLHDEMKRRREHFDSGYDEQMALEQWLKLCGPVALDEDIFRFIRNEMSLRERAQVGEWQETLIRLINFVLRNGMPMDRLSPRPTFQQESRQARNSEEALLCVLNICARLTEKLSDIDWPTAYACGDWLAQIQGQREASENTMSWQCLSYLNLKNCILYGRDLSSADLRNSSLEGGSLAHANLSFARLERTTLQGCDLSLTLFYGANLHGQSLAASNFERAILKGSSWNEANLNGANLSRYDLSEIRFVDAQLEGANLEQTFLTGAWLSGTNLKNANLQGAILSKAFLIETDFTGADLERAVMEGADLTYAKLDDANLENAFLKDAKLMRTSLRGANLMRANLAGANLANADLEGAKLDEADLAGAKLDGIKVKEENLRNDYLRRAGVKNIAPQGSLSSQAELSTPGEAEEGDRK